MAAATARAVAETNEVSLRAASCCGAAGAVDVAGSPAVVGAAGSPSRAETVATSRPKPCAMTCERSWPPGSTVGGVLAGRTGPSPGAPMADNSPAETAALKSGRFREKIVASCWCNGEPPARQEGADTAEGVAGGPPGEQRRYHPGLRRGHRPAQFVGDRKGNLLPAIRAYPAELIARPGQHAVGVGGGGPQNCPRVSRAAVPRGGLRAGPRDTLDAEMPGV